MRVNRRVLIVNGAIRVKGNTDILVNKIMEGSANTEVKIDLVTLREKRVGNCVGCYKCLDEGICSVQDDMTEIRNRIQDSQLLILASPLYWCGVTGLMKTFIDRLFFYYHLHTKVKISGKRAIIITPMNQTNVIYESETLVQFYNRLLNCLGIKLVDMFFFGGIMRKGDIERKPQYLEEAFKLGQNLLNLIEKDERLQRVSVHVVD
jgi:multimeric flavodoxin WrbA